MPPKVLFLTQLVLGYAAWLLCFRAYILPWLRSLGQAQAHRAIATLHSFRFFGLVFLLDGVVGPNLPRGFALFAAYGDLAAGLLALLALLAVHIKPLFWTLVVAFNLVGAGDLLLNYYHATRVGLPELAGQLASAYAIPVLYVPILLITHVAAVYWLLRPLQERLATDSTAETVA